jgi:hypothetical protein
LGRWSGRWGNPSLPVIATKEAIQPPKGIPLIFLDRFIPRDDEKILLQKLDEKAMMETL